MDAEKKRKSIVDATAVEDEADVFEITDFTTASEWERFIAQLEEVLHEWKLVNHEPRPPAMKDQYAHGSWAEKSEEIVFADFRFTLTYLYLKTGDNAPSDNSTVKKDWNEDVDEEHKAPTVFFDLMNFDNDFPSRAHYLCRWYGLQEMCTLSPVSEKQSIESESRARILLSSASIAFGNSNCSIPVFVQLHHSTRRLFSGTCISRGASVEFEMSQLRRFPPQFCHLAGLLDIFKSKLGCVYISMPPVSVSVRFTFVLQDWIHSAWPQAPPDFSSFCDGEVGHGDIGFLPFGACKDPISELHLSCTWPCLSEDVIVENSRYSDLDPLQAPLWTVCLQMIEDPQCLLGEYLQDFVKLCDRPETMEDLLKGIMPEATATDKQAAEISHAFQRLTEPVPSLSAIPSLGKVVSSTSSRIKIMPEHAPIPDSLLDKILFYLFPDAEGSRAASPNAKQMREKRQGSVSSSVSTPDTEQAPELKAGTKDQKNDCVNEIITELNKQMKSAPSDSLVQKLALALCNVNHSYGGLLGIAQLWQEFILEMRFRWENKHLICGVGSGPPNMGSCMLFQKLQMLNCCIEFKVKRESQMYGYGPDSVNVHNQSFDSNDSQGKDGHNNDTSDNVDGARGFFSDDEDDEFFECAEDEPDSGGKGDAAAVAGGGGGDTNTETSGDTNESCLSVVKTEGDTAVDHTKDKNEEENKESKSSKKAKPGKDRSGSFYDTLPHKPEGRRVAMKNMFLLANGEQMYIPFTQEPSPMTEDMLEEHAEVLAKLGTSPEGSQIRARMQSACLVSDMESFKGANPGCLLDDFVRWYSPRDYITEEEVSESSDAEKDIGSGTELAAQSRRGHLSQRMQIPGNMWVEAWQSAKSVPARRQKRLFDDTKEAEKVLHYLTSLKPAEVLLHVMPCVIHATIVKVVEESDSAGVPNIKSLLDQIISRATKVTRNFPLDQKKYTDLLRLIEMAEVLIARTKSLRSKFAHDLNLLNQEGKEEEIESFVNSLLTQAEVPVRGGAHGPAGAIIHKMFIAAQRSNHMILDDADDDLSEAGSATSSRKNSATPSASSINMDTSSTATSSSCPDFPPPSAREYILRAMVPRPAPYSKVLPQRMYCLLTEGDNRLAGAFTSDSTFQ